MCTCCTPRNATSRNKRQGKDHVSSHSAEDITSQPERDFRTQITRPAGLVVVANSGEFRPVLPRPQPQPSPPSVHGNPEAPHVSSGRQAVMYSPYGRAYEQTRGVEVTSPEPLLPSVFTTPSPIPEPAPQSPVPQSDPDATAWWASMASFPPSQIAATTCGCGSGCGCPNCLVHHPDPNNVNAPSNCSNPGTCNTCLDCTILSLPSSIPPDTPLSRYEASQYPSIDDWIQQVSSLTSQTNGSIGPSLSQLPPPPAPTEQDVRFNPSSWQTYALYSSLQAQGLARSAPQECCGGRCGCPSGMCVCSADCCGCCQGCSCSDCDRMNVTGGGGGGGKTLTFAVSGERGSCCGSTKSDSDRRSPLAGTGNGGSASGYRPVANNSFLGPATWDNSYLGVPRAFDSGASSSSRSSSPHSHSSCGSSNRSDGTRQQLDLVSGGGGGGGGGGDVQSCCAAMRVMDAPSSSRSASHSVSRAPAVYYAPPLDPPPPFSGVSAPQRTLTDFDYDSAMMFN